MDDTAAIVDGELHGQGDFRDELEKLINTHSKENPSGTPDFILADYMADCLDAFDKAIERRTMWLKD